MSEQFKKGDLVRSKSEGPEMIVNAVGTGSDGQGVICVWFDGPIKHYDFFRSNALVRSERVVN